MYALVGWLSLHIRRQTNWLQAIYKSLLGNALPYLSSLVTIAAPTIVASAPAGIFHWSPLKPIAPLAAFPSSFLLPMTGTNCKNTFKYQLSEQLTDPYTCT
jgi:hypothetical protein